MKRKQTQTKTERNTIIEVYCLNLKGNLECIIKVLSSRQI